MYEAIITTTEVSYDNDDYLVVMIYIQFKLVDETMKQIDLLNLNPDYLYNLQMNFIHHNVNGNSSQRNWVDYQTLRH